jgi:methanethiol S-methyltransferase
MKKTIFLLYATICYVIFFATFLYLIGFVENLIVPKSIDSNGLVEEQSLNLGIAILINLGLIALFGIQHSVMARSGFKAKWQKIIPTPIERSTYVLFASLVLMILFFFWKPISSVIWDFSGSMTGNILLGISFLGWGIVLLSTFLINHFHLFGLYQVYQYVLNKKQKDTFKMPFLYKIVRHPLYLGFLVAFWATPVMTAGHLLFTIGMTIYILIGIHHEEKDLIKTHGETYRQYRSETPKLIPFWKKIN